MRKASDLSGLGQLLKQGIFAIPAYQRDYAWKSRDVDTLLDDIFNIMASGNQHYIGSIVVMKADRTFQAYSKQGELDSIQNSGGVDIYHVVDGQQRLTCCSMILCALYEAIENEPDIEFPRTHGPSSKNDLLNTIYSFIFDNESYIGDSYAPRLFLNNDPSAQYHNCLPGTEPMRSKGWRLRNAYERIKNKLREHKASSDLSTSDYYVAFRNAVVNQLKIDDVCCDDFGSAFQIFESINAKGQPLSSADLIKCYLIQKASSVNTADADRRWNKLLETVGASSDKTTDLDRFMGIFLFTANEARVSKARAYDVFKKLYDGVSYQQSFEDLQNAADVYRKLAIENPSDRWKDDNPLKTFKVLKLSSIYVPLLAAARFYEDGIKDDRFEELKKRLAPFAIRYQVCGKTSNSLDKPFEGMIKRIKRGESADAVMGELKKKGILPSDDEFRLAFKELTFKDSEEPLATHLLVGLEAFVELNEHKSNKQLPTDYTLEHIIPKEYSKFVEEWDDYDPENFKEEIVRSIGNLALISKPDNTSAGNQPYSKKLPIYRSGSRASEASPTSSYNLLSAVVSDYPEFFTVSSVVERQDSLAIKAASCW